MLLTFYWKITTVFCAFFSIISTLNTVELNLRPTGRIVYFMLTSNPTTTTFSTTNKYTHLVDYKNLPQTYIIFTF